jgi:hypothetical protein
MHDETAPRAEHRQREEVKGCEMFHRKQELELAIVMGLDRKNTLSGGGNENL